MSVPKMSVTFVCKQIHLYRVLFLLMMFFTMLFVLFILPPSPSCIQVSVSIEQWQPYPYKRYRKPSNDSLPSLQRTNIIVAQAKAIKTVASDIKTHPDVIKPIAHSKNPLSYETRPNSIESKSHNIVSVFKQRLKSVFNTEAFFRTRIVKHDPKTLGENVTEEEDYGEVYLNDGEVYLNDDDDTAESEDDYYGDLPDNKIFEDGDFDYNETSRLNSGQPSFSVIEELFEEFVNSSTFSNINAVNYSSQVVSNQPLSVLKPKYRNITLINVEGVPIVEEGIYWSEELEKQTPKGWNDHEAERALQKLRSSKVKRVEPPTWNRCGRPKNQFVVFEDDSKACARYRAPHQYLVQGEILSFYLARMLKITNVPVVALSTVKEDFSDQWNREGVKKNLTESKWETNTTVALIQWIDNLERDKLPKELLSALIKKSVLSMHRGSLLSLTVKDLTDLLQWSDLIVFDYITGNYDRVASMQDAADKESRPSILSETVHNLVRSRSTGALWLIDNESGLLDSYSLLYGRPTDGRFRSFHRQTLAAVCLFRRSTARRVAWLHRSGRAAHLLLGLVQRFEPLFQPEGVAEVVAVRLQERVAEVYQHMERCRAAAE